MTQYRRLKTNGKRTAEIKLRVTPVLKERIKQTIKDRKYPDPYDPSKYAKFNSVNEFAEYTLACIVKMNPKIFNGFFATFLNPMIDDKDLINFEDFIDGNKRSV